MHHFLDIQVNVIPKKRDKNTDFPPLNAGDKINMLEQEISSGISEKKLQ